MNVSLQALAPQRLGKEFRRSLVIAWKDIRIYCLKPPVLLFGLVFPFFLFLSFYVGKKGPVNEGIPGLVSIAVFFASSTTSPPRACPSRGWPGPSSATSPPPYP